MPATIYSSDAYKGFQKYFSQVVSKAIKKALASCSGTLILQSSIGGKLSQKEDTKMRRTFSPDYKVAPVKLVTEQG
ncbi:hypothetical protein JL04_08710, partial [Gallibacterium anatis]|uniref:hypothetical protein n=1 Tax=Gallibacterium anatis TaxID=750 RepID=UPI000530E2B8